MPSQAISIHLKFHITFTVKVKLKTVYGPFKRKNLLTQLYCVHNFEIMFRLAYIPLRTSGDDKIVDFGSTCRFYVVI